MQCGEQVTLTSIRGSGRSQQRKDGRRGETKQTETGHASKDKDRQATRHNNTKWNGTRQDEMKAAAPTAKPQGRKGREGEGEGKARGGDKPVQESRGPRGSHMIP